MYMGPPYTEDQLLERAYIQIKRTGLFSTGVVKWEGFGNANKTWPEWKSHLIKAYELRKTAGITVAQRDTTGRPTSWMRTIHKG